MKDLGVVRVVYTDVSRDGLLRGINIEETTRLAQEVGIRVIASGGAAGEADVRALWERRSSGVEGVILGRSLYEKKIDLRELQARVSSWFGPC
jgi:phosphoribosylformimino-5-aminoimidazole carboxamide ribotide isomerase